MYVFVPPNLTNQFQPLDSNVNRHAKTLFKRKVSAVVCTASPKRIIETKVSLMKPIHARWIVSLCEKFRNSYEMIIKAFDMAFNFITEALTNVEMEGEGPFSHL